MRSGDQPSPSRASSRDRRRACLLRHGAILTAARAAGAAEIFDQAAAASGGCAARAAHGTSPTRAGCASHRRRARAHRRSRAPRASTPLHRHATARRASRAAPRTRRPRRRRGARRAAARRCRSSGSPAAGTRRRSAPRAGSGRAAPPMPNAIAEPASRPRWRTRKRRCLPSPTVDGSATSQPSTSSTTPGLPMPERREPLQLGAEVEPELRAGHDRVDARHRAQVVLREHRVGMRRERRRERLDALGLDRQPGGGAVTAEALRCPAHAPRPACRSNAGTERPEPFHSPSVPAMITTGRL